MMKINTEKCTLCGECLKECPTRAVKKNKSGLFIDPDMCILCGHCAAVCKFGAVSGQKLFPHEKASIQPQELLKFLQNKRSVRRYSGRQIAEEQLVRIASSAVSAATATNTMDWQLYIYTGDRLEQLRSEMLSRFYKFRGIVSFALKFPPVRLFGLKSAARPYLLKKGTGETFRAFITDIENGKDPLLFSAPAMMVLTSPSWSGDFGPANCTIAGSQMMEMAFSMGIGSCMIGFAEFILNMFPSVRKKAGIPRSQQVRLVFTLGYPDVEFFYNPVRDFQILLNGEKIRL